LVENAFSAGSEAFPIRKGGQSSLVSAIWQDITSKYTQIESEILSLSLSLSLSRYEFGSMILPHHIPRECIKKSKKTRYRLEHQSSSMRKGARRVSVTSRKLWYRHYVQIRVWYAPMLTPITSRSRALAFERAKQVEPMYSSLIKIVIRRNPYVVA